jgi:hypothetical protein
MKRTIILLLLFSGSSLLLGCPKPDMLDPVTRAAGPSTVTIHEHGGVQPPIVESGEATASAHTAPSDSSRETPR